MMADLLQTSLALALVLASIGAAAWLVKSARRHKSGASQAIQIEASVVVGPHERLVLVEVAGQRLLLGVAPGRVNTLAQLAAAAPDDAPAAAVPRTFWLASYLEKINGK